MLTIVRPDVDAVVATHVTADDLGSLEADGYRYDLLAGDLIRVAPAGFRAGRIAHEISSRAQYRRWSTARAAAIEQAWTVAIIQAAIGVREDAIAADFALSSQQLALAAPRPEFERFFGELDSPREDIIRAMATLPETMHALFERIRVECGSARNLLHAYGVADETLVALRAQTVERAWAAAADTAVRGSPPLDDAYWDEISYHYDECCKARQSESVRQEGMTMSPFEAELHAQWRREELAREAETERLAVHARQSRPGVRWRLARVIYALAVSLEPTGGFS
jgi:hypothetical protein